MLKASLSSKPRIVMVGGGSVNWSPKLINDLTLTPELNGAEYVIHDINTEAGEKMTRLGNNVCRSRGLDSVFHFAATQQEAFPGADFIIITISTGGLDAMEYDLKIPEDYGIFHTVGDTVGPGGWARCLRNIPVFKEMAQNIKRYSPHATVLNYTNPMAVLTNVFFKTSSLSAVGLCHSPMENHNLLAQLLGIIDENELKLTFAGTNHFFWINDFTAGGEDGYELLKHKKGSGTFMDLLGKAGIKESCHGSRMQLCGELYDHLGFLPYVGDRHTCEFLTHYNTFDPGKLERYGIKRTPVDDRRKLLKDGRERLDALLAGGEKLDDTPSREIAADIIKTHINRSSIIDVVNLPNTGQIENLPIGSIVETMGAIDADGFRPLGAGKLPTPVLNLVLPQVVNQDLTAEAGLEGDLEKAFWALYNDPLCAHLSLGEVREMGTRLLKAHRQYLPQFSL